MYHYNDRFYESNSCPTCGQSEMAKTVKELEDLLSKHSC